MERGCRFVPYTYYDAPLGCVLSRTMPGIPHQTTSSMIFKRSSRLCCTNSIRVHDGVINTMQNASPIQQTLMRSALRLGKANAAHKNGVIDDDTGEVVPSLGLVDRFKYKVLDDMVLSKIRERFGNLRAG